MMGPSGALAGGSADLTRTNNSVALARLEAGAAGFGPDWHHGQHRPRPSTRGATESGLPYFVMNLVPACHVTNPATDNRLSPRERLGVVRSNLRCHPSRAPERALIPETSTSERDGHLYDGNPSQWIASARNATER